MTYTIDWLVPGRVLEAVIVEEVSEQALLDSDHVINEMLDTASQPVHFLIDVRQMKTHPSAQTTFKLTYYKHRNMGHFLIIGFSMNPMLRFLNTLVGRAVGFKVKDFKTRDEAIAYLTTIEKV